MTEHHTCPRRMSDFGPWERKEGLDEYTKGHGLVGQHRGCNFCGSMHPDDFMQAVRDGLEIGPTDKSYKLYVKGIPYPEPDALRIVSSSTGPGQGLTAYKDLSRAEKKAVRVEYKGRRRYPEDYKEGYYHLIPWGPTVEGKFYTAHLSQEQGWEFDGLWREHKINWGYPGAPYRPLYIPGPSDQGGL